MAKVFHLDQDDEPAAPGSVRKKAPGSSKRARQRQAVQQEAEEEEVPEEEAKSTQKRSRTTDKQFTTKTEVNKARVAQLREFCEANALSQAGKKADLVARVWTYVSEAESPTPTKRTGGRKRN